MGFNTMILVQKTLEKIYFGWQTEVVDDHTLRRSKGLVEIVLLIRIKIHLAFSFQHPICKE